MFSHIFFTRLFYLVVFFFENLRQTLESNRKLEENYGEKRKRWNSATRRNNWIVRKHGGQVYAQLHTKTDRTCVTSFFFGPVLGKQKISKTLLECVFVQETQKTIVEWWVFGTGRNNFTSQETYVERSRTRKNKTERKWEKGGEKGPRGNEKLAEPTRGLEFNLSNCAGQKQQKRRSCWLNKNWHAFCSMKTDRFSEKDYWILKV